MTDDIIIIDVDTVIAFRLVVYFIFRYNINERSIYFLASFFRLLIIIISLSSCAKRNGNKMPRSTAAALIIILVDCIFSVSSERVRLWITVWGPKLTERDMWVGDGW